MSTAMSDGDLAMELWSSALQHTEQSNPSSLEWAHAVNADTYRNLKSKNFLRHYCYVVYASGFKACIIQEVFSELRKSFSDFELQKLERMRSIRKPLEIFGSERKARNFLDGAQMIAQEGYGNFKQRLQREGLDVLEELPGIGPITKFHLAKNIGLADVAKPDIWLERAAELCGYISVNALVQFLHETTGESRHVIDTVIWNLGKDRGFKSRGASHG